MVEYLINGVIAFLIALAFYVLTRRDFEFMLKAFEGSGLISLIRKNGRITSYGMSLGADLKTSTSMKADLTVVPPDDGDVDETPEERKKRHERLLEALIPPPLIPEYPDES